MKVCSRCKNENLKEEYKYCPICGLGTAPEVVIKLLIDGKVITEKVQIKPIYSEYLSSLAKKLSSNLTKMEYEKKIKELCSNRLIGFKSKKEDAQLIAKLIETLAGEENLSISHAQAILSDIQMILPMIINI